MNSNKWFSQLSDFSQAFGTNNPGDIVGISNSRAVLWPRNGGIQDLNIRSGRGQ
jgi:hypothetical protein